MADFPILPIPSSDYKPSTKTNTEVSASESGYEHRRKKGPVRVLRNLSYKGIDSANRKTLRDFYISTNGNVTNFNFYDFEALARYDTTYLSYAYPWDRAFYLQRFKATRSTSFNVVRIYLKKLGSPAGNMTADLLTTGGTLLATSTTTLSVPTITTSYAWYDFNFSEYSLTKDTSYDVRFTATGYIWTAGISEIQSGVGAKQTDEFWAEASPYTELNYSAMHLVSTRYKMRFDNEELVEEFIIGDRANINVSLIEDF